MTKEVAIPKGVLYPAGRPRGQDGNPTKRGPGAPPKYRADVHPRILAVLVRNGARNSEIAEAFGISEKTISKWAIKHPEFREALHASLHECTKHVERALYHRAVGYQRPAVKVGFSAKTGRVWRAPYVEVVEPDMQAIQYWLNNRAPQDWKSKVELSSNPDAPFGSATIDATQLTTEELRLLMAIKARQEGERQAIAHEPEPIEQPPAAAPVIEAEAVPVVRDSEF